MKRLSKTAIALGTAGALTLGMVPNAAGNPIDDLINGGTWIAENAPEAHPGIAFDDGTEAAEIPADGTEAEWVDELAPEDQPGIVSADGTEATEIPADGTEAVWVDDLAPEAQPGIVSADGTEATDFPAAGTDAEWVGDLAEEQDDLTADQLPKQDEGVKVTNGDGTEATEIPAAGTDAEWVDELAPEGLFTNDDAQNLTIEELRELLGGTRAEADGTEANFVDVISTGDVRETWVDALAPGIFLSPLLPAAIPFFLDENIFVSEGNGTEANAADIFGTTTLDADGHGEGAAWVDALADGPAEKPNKVRPNVGGVEDAYWAGLDAEELKPEEIFKDGPNWALIGGLIGGGLLLGGIIAAIVAVNNHQAAAAEKPAPAPAPKLPAAPAAPAAPQAPEAEVVPAAHDAAPAEAAQQPAASTDEESATGATEGEAAGAASQAPAQADAQSGSNKGADNGAQSGSRGVAAHTGNNGIAQGLLALVLATVVGAAALMFGRRKAA